MISRSVILLISWIGIVGVSANTTQLRSHTDNYDITTIYKIWPAYIEDAGYTTNNSRFNSIEIHLRTNAIGMPIEFNGIILSSKKKSLEFIADKQYPTNILTQNNIEYNVNEWDISTFSMSNNQEVSKSFSYNLLLWKANNNEELFKISWKQKNTIQLCISISYILNDVSKCEFSMEIFNENNTNKEYSHNFQEAKELKTLLIKGSQSLFTNISYSISLKLEKRSERRLINHYDDYRYSYYTNKYQTIYADGCEIGIKRIAQCTDENENEDLQKITTEELKKNSLSTLIFNVYPIGHNPIALTSSSHSSTSSKCFNGGFAYKDECICPPGFKGNNCDYGCGSNSFGDDCFGMCSMHQSQCQKMIFCTNRFGCTCPTGYRGNNCDIECTRGTYGNNCRQRCSESCNAGVCDIFTGDCNEGCKNNYILPNCIEKYPWFNYPPQLESSDFRSLKLKLNLTLENKNGSKKINSIYYQIIFKPALNDSDFQYMELKEIGQQISVIETIEDLKPGTLYSFGVMLVSEDGNYNYEDTKIANYSTLCQLPKSTEYEINLLSSTNYINVTWNKLNKQNEDECKITEYLLKLIFKDIEFHKKSSLEEISSNSRVGYIFENLMSGQEYAIEVTAISASGQVEILKTAYISTEHYGFVKIKNIKAKLHDNQSALVISWDIEDKYKIPMTFIVKYKVNKYLSCSHKIISNNWTSILVYNQTKREIWDLIPNTQYILKVEPTIKGYTYNDYQNIIFVKTPISTPELMPFNNEYSSYVTNQTSYFNWTINMNECFKLNGFFLGYHIVLKNIFEGTQILNTTKQNMVSYEGLKPDTKYEIQIYAKTNYGFNKDKGLIIPFKTKSKFLEPVDELTVYMKDLKHKSVGIRWSFPVEYDVINGFIIIITNEIIHNEKQITVKPEHCIAWPKFYCNILEDLIPNHQFTIKIKAKSLDYPTGGWPASIVSNFDDGISDKPGNLKATIIGSQHITLKWDIPWILNGVLKSFLINIEQISSKDITQCCDNTPDIEIKVTEEIPNYNCTIYNLKPDSTYSIGVLSKTSSYGQTNRIHVTTLPTS